MGQKTASHLQQPSFPSLAQGILQAETEVLLLLRISHHILIRGQEVTSLAGLKTVAVSIKAQPSPSPSNPA